MIEKQRRLKRFMLLEYAATSVKDNILGKENCVWTWEKIAREKQGEKRYRSYQNLAEEIKTLPQ